MSVLIAIKSRVVDDDRVFHYWSFVSSERNVGQLCFANIPCEGVIRFVLALATGGIAKALLESWSKSPARGAYVCLIQRKPEKR